MGTEFPFSMKNKVLELGNNECVLGKSLFEREQDKVGVKRLRSNTAFPRRRSAPVFKTPVKA